MRDVRFKNYKIDHAPSHVDLCSTVSFVCIFYRNGALS